MEQFLEKFYNILDLVYTASMEERIDNIIPSFNDPTVVMEVNNKFNISFEDGTYTYEDDSINIRIPRNIKLATFVYKDEVIPVTKLYNNAYIVEIYLCLAGALQLVSNYEIKKNVR